MAKKKKKSLIPFWKLSFKMNRGHVSKWTDVTWNTAAARLVFALEGGGSSRARFCGGCPDCTPRATSLLKPALFTGVFIFPNSWKFCKSCFCPLLFKYFCFWQKGKWKSIFKCILHLFFCCFPLCSGLGVDNELTDVCGSLGGLSPMGTAAPWLGPWALEDAVCSSPRSFQPILHWAGHHLPQHPTPETPLLCFGP